MLPVALPALIPQGDRADPIFRGLPGFGGYPALRLLIVLLGLLAALLATMGAVVPRLVDAETVRSRLLAEVQQALGRPVSVRGSAELVLLPRPVLSVGRVTVGAAPGGKAGTSVEIDRVDLDLAPLALLAGRTEVEQAHIVRPHLRLEPQDGGPLALLAALAGDEQPLRRVRVVDGDVRFQRPGLPPETVEQVGLELERRADGGLDAHGSGRWRAQPWTFDLGLADPNAGRAGPMQLRLGFGTGGHSGLLALEGMAGPFGAYSLAADFQGDVRFDTQELAELAAPLAAASGLALAPLERLRLGPASLAGKLTRTADRWRLELAGLSLAGGTLTGRAEVDTARPSLDLDLEGSGLAPGADMAEAVTALAGVRRPPAGLTGGIDLRLATLEWRGMALRDLRLAASLPGDDTLKVDRLSARLPDEGQASLQGVLSGLSADPSWRGRLDLSAQNLRGLLERLGLPPPELAPDRLRSLDGSADLAWAGRQLTLRDIDLRLDATRVTGSGAVALARRPQVAASLHVDRLALDGYLPQAEPAGLGALLAQAAAQADMALDLDLGVLSWEAIRAERVRLRGDVEGQAVTLRELSVGDLAEASGSMVGGGDLGTGSLELALEAQVARPSRLARLAGIEPPPLLGRVQPVRLTGNVRRGGDGIAVELEAAAPGLSLDVDARLPAGLDGPPRLERLVARAPSLAELARMVGLPVPAGAALAGAAEVELGLRPAPAGVTQVEIRAGLGRSRATAALRHDPAGPRPRIDGRIEVADLDPALVQLGWDLGEVALGFPPGPPSRWPGAWPRETQSWAWLYAADLDLAVRGLAQGHVGLAAGSLDIDVETAPLAGGSLSGRLGLDGSDIPKLQANLDLRGADAAQAMGLAGLGQGLRGRMDLQVTASSTGASPAALAAALDGTARLRLADGAIDGFSLEPADIALGPRSLPVSLLEGSLGIERGMAVGNALRLAMPGGDAVLSLRLDLPAWMLDATIEDTARGRALRLLGPPGRVRPVVASP